MSCSIQNNRKVNMENISASNYNDADYVYLDNKQHFLLDEKDNNMTNNMDTVNNMGAVNNMDTANILTNNRVITTSEPIHLLDNDADEVKIVSTVKKNKLINYIIIGIILVSIIRYSLHNKPSDPTSYLYSSSTTI